MSRMSVLCQTKSLACSQLNHNTSILAVRLLEPWHDRTTPSSARRFYTHIGGSRQAYQMDWSQTSHKNLVGLCSQVHQWNTPQIWFPQYNYNRSWIKLHFARILGLLRELQHRHQICINCATKSQWPSGTHQRTDKWLAKKGGKWQAELPMVIWGLCTQPSKATGQTPFFLVYGSEVILPADIMWKSP